MIAFFIKNWKLFLDILLVVGAILAFTFWDPFNIFMNSKTKQTANLVTGVREIGQLVTAEYYGEVLSSWKEFKLRPYREDELMENAEDLYLVLKNKTDDRTLNATLAGLKKDDTIKTMYPKLIAFLGTKYLKRGLHRIYNAKNNTLKPGLETKIIKKIVDERDTYRDRLIKKFGKSKEAEENVRALYDLYLDSIPPFMQEFYAFHSMLTKQNMTEGKNKRKNIVFVGRGWVKAGFDFDSFNENNFWYDDENKTVHLYGLSPRILDKDINPWFIPQRKIKGFELVDFTGEVTFQEAKEVKADCKRKLVEQANRAEIVTRAQENGEEALRNFFSLLLNEPDLKIRFHRDPFEKYLAVITEDTLISLNEALLIDSIYRNEKARIEKIASPDAKEKKSRQLAGFIETLKAIPFLNEKRYPFSFYSLIAARIMKDSFHISAADGEMMMAYRADIILDPQDNTRVTTDSVLANPNWFSSGDFMTEFNNSLSLLRDESLSSADSTLKNSGYDVGFRLALQTLGDTVRMDSLLRSRGKNPPEMAMERTRMYHAARNKLIHDQNVKPLTLLNRRIKDFRNRLKF